MIKHSDIYNEIKANRDLLSSCSLHAFEVDLKPGQVFGKEWKCSSCGGVVHAMEKSWYEKGLKHGGKAAK